MQGNRHFRTCRAPDVADMPRGFAPDAGLFATHDPAVRFEMTRAGDEFFQAIVRSTPAGEQRISARIDLVYGAGTADDVYLSWKGDQLFELPMGWIYTLDRWGVNFNPHSSGDFSRPLTLRCLECHSTWFEHVAGTPNRYVRETLIPGVTCERCHGPGREHVAFHEAHPEADSGRAIIHPARLPRDRQLELCTQCHSNAIKHLGPALSYRPGQPLDACYRTVESRYSEDDHVANQVHYLRQSRCFQKSDTLTCITCHDPHRPSASSDATSAQASCLKCHAPGQCGARDRLPTPIRNDCVGCHMPQRVKMNVIFRTADDAYVPPIRRYEHRIAVDRTAEQEVLLAWYRMQPDDDSRRKASGLQASQVAHWLAEAENFRRQYRFRAMIGAYREALRVDDSPGIRELLRDAVALQDGLDDEMSRAMRHIEEKRFAEAITALTGILLIKPDHAKAHGRLGTCYAISGQRELAAEHLQAAAQYDPDDSYGFAMLGWLAYLDNRYDEALEFYRRADEIEPYNAKIHQHWGLVLTKLKRLPEAIERFRGVLVIDPDHLEACLSLGQSLRQVGKPQEAIKVVQRAARLTGHRNPDILAALAETFAEAGDWGHAADAAAEALEATRSSNSALATQIRGRLVVFRARARKPIR